jgi:predicted transcriptional regulator
MINMGLVTFNKKDGKQTMPVNVYALTINMQR